MHLLLICQIFPAKDTRDITPHIWSKIDKGRFVYF